MGLRILELILEIIFKVMERINVLWEYFLLLYYYCCVLLLIIDDSKEVIIYKIEFIISF